MSYEKVGGPKKYYKYSECEPDQVLVEGKFIGRSKNKFNKDKPNFDFKTEEGVVCLNYAGKLDYLVEEYVQVGDKVKVIFKGKEVMESGTYEGKEVNAFELFVDNTSTQMELPLEAKPESGSIDLSDLD